MDIERYRQQHGDILRDVGSLRDLIQAGIAQNAETIAQLIVSMSTGIKFHLAAEDAVLYPALLRADDAATVELSRSYQSEMQGIAAAFGEFVRKWRVGAHIAGDPEGFRVEANAVFRALHERIRRENQELYPAAERLQREAAIST